MCGVDREEKLGLCLCPSDMIINRIAPHYYEEPPISGTNGSGTVFFGGCVMRCAYCQNSVISREPKGKSYSPLALAEEIKQLEDKGVHNINFVTPTQYSDNIRRALDIYRPRVPIVYNTSGYERVEVIKDLLPYVDVFLPDFKYSDNALALRLSKRDNYVETALNAIQVMLENKPTVYEKGLLKQGVIIRHLVLPNYVKNSLNALDMIVERFGKDFTMSIMSQFTPMPACDDLNRKLKPIEYKMVLNHAVKLGLENVFIQEMDSAEDIYIPPFDVD